MDEHDQTSTLSTSQPPLVLLVDDNRELCEGLAYQMQSFGCRVLLAAEGAEALELARKHRPDLIISDLLMPNMDGFELCRQLRLDPQLAGMRVLFLTGAFTEEGDIQLANKLGVAAVLFKPIDGATLHKAIEGALFDRVLNPQPLFDPTLFQSQHQARMSEKLLRTVNELEIALRGMAQMERKYRRMVENLGSGYFLYSRSANGNLSYLSPSAALTLDLSDEEAKARLQQLLPPPHPADNGDDTSGPHRFELIVGDGRGKSRHFECSETRIVESGLLPQIEGVAHDISYQKQLQRSLQLTLDRTVGLLHGAIAAIAQAAEVRDPYTAGHQRRVAQLSLAIARRLGIEGEQLTGIELGAIIHDLGKINVPSELLAKPSRLTPIELSLIREHCRTGHEILKRIDFPWPIAEIALQHHELLDGSGYPQGLIGDEIMLEARIVGVADVVEAMASHRPYRPALGINEPLEYIRSRRGTLYDAQVVDVCLELFASGEFHFT